MNTPSLRHMVMRIPLRWPRWWHEKRVAYWRFRACALDCECGVARFDALTRHIQPETLRKTLLRLAVYLLRVTAALTTLVPYTVFAFAGLLAASMERAADWFSDVCDKWLDGVK